MFDSSTFTEEFVSGHLDSGLRNFVIKVQALDHIVLAWRGSAWEGEHDALWDVVEGTVGLEADRLPFAASEGPVAHVVD